MKVLVGNTTISHDDPETCVRLVENYIKREEVENHTEENALIGYDKLKDDYMYEFKLSKVEGVCKLFILRVRKDGGVERALLFRELSDVLEYMLNDDKLSDLFSHTLVD